MFKSTLLPFPVISSKYVKAFDPKILPIPVAPFNAVNTEDAWLGIILVIPYNIEWLVGLD